MAKQQTTRRGGAKRWLARYPLGLPLAAFLLVALITALSVVAIEQGVDARAAAQQRTRAGAIASALERRANSGSAYLRAGAALLATLDDVPAATFNRFVSELRLDSDYRGADGVGWAPVVRPGEVAAFNQTMARESPGGASLHPALDGTRPFAVPVELLQPDTARNRLALGFDMYSEPVRRAALVEAERSGRPTASGKVVLRQEGDAKGAGFLIYMPVFEPTASGRRLRGYIYSPFNAQDFLESALELEDAGSYGVRLYDGPASHENLLATVSGDPSHQVSTVFEPVSIGNSPWLLAVAAPGSRGLSGLAMVTLVFGVLVAGLLALMIRLLTQQALEDEESLRWLEEQASIRNSLTRELNHRVKNTLANVLSIIALTRRRAKTLGEFADGLDGRIRALSATHDLLTHSDWGTTPVRAVVEAELLPYTQEGDHETDLQGPEIHLAPNDALSLGLATHELATNAAKYGALSRSGGKVSVHWRLVSDTLMRIEWQESGGPPVPEKRGRGFGTDLIERIVAHELKTPVELDFAPGGVRCVLTIPVRRRSEFAMRAGRMGSRADAVEPA